VDARELLPDGGRSAVGEESSGAIAEIIAFAANALPALIAYLDSAARYVWVNDRYGSWFGRPRQEIIGKHPSQLLDPAAWCLVKPYVDRALAGEEVAFDNRVTSADGGARDVRASYVPHRDSRGRVRGVVVMVTDITEMKATETALRRSERMLEQSQAAAHVGSWELTSDEGLAEVPGSSLWSREAYRILGYQPGTPASLALFSQRLHPDDRAPLRERFAECVGRGEPFQTEYRVLHPDDGERVIHAWLHFQRDADGATTHAFGTCQDITERRRAELETRRARAQLQLVVDSTPAFIARYDRDRRLVWANKSYAARFGKAPEELAGRRLIDLVGEPAFRVLDPFCARVMAGQSVQAEIEIPYPSGSRVVYMTLAPTLDAVGAYDGCVAVLTDVTDGRRLAAERDRALDELLEADRRKDAFLAMLAHELRNPLGAILIAQEVLATLEPGSEQLAAEYLQIVAQQTRHMKRLLDDLLDVSRVSRGKIELQKERVDVNALVLRAIDVNRATILEKHQELSLELCRQPIPMEADPVRLVQVFDNLINNAAKYTDPGGHITILSAVENGAAIVKVRDDGVGMTPELLARAFDLFAQGGRSLDRTQGGLGVGLTLVRMLLELHGGSVQAFSPGPGRGSELVVRLPLGPLPEPPPPKPTDEPHQRSGAALRVLVVDDNADAAKGLGQVLRLTGHQVTLAHDGPAALAAASQAPPDLVLLDIGLPGMDGYAVAARLREAGHARAALVAVSGYGQPADLRRSREAGFDDHLIKPIDAAQLKSLCLQVANRRRTFGR
jgi:PAS domain S-box-containing protein